MLEAVTKDQLNTGLTGQIRYRVSESNLYAYLFGVKKPVVHIMGYFVSILRERIANFAAKPITVTVAVADDGGNLIPWTSKAMPVREVIGRVHQRLCARIYAT